MIFTNTYLFFKREYLFYIEWRHLQRNLNCIRVQQYLKDQLSIDHDLCKTPRHQQKKATQKFLILRLQVIVGISSGLEYVSEYMYKMNLVICIELYSILDSVLFRDLKPTNIGISSGGVPLIFDFGLAREIVSSFSRIALTPCFSCVI